MLVLPLKGGNRTDIHNQLATWLDNDDSHQSFSNNGNNSIKPTNPLQFVTPKPAFNSTQCRKDLVRLSAVRNCLVDAVTKSNSHKNAMRDNALRDLHEYHAILLEYEKRGFPTIDDEANGVRLIWNGAFASTQSELHHSLVWDRANVLWNTVALETSLANEKLTNLLSSSNADNNNNNNTKDGYKECIQHYQNSASIISILSQLVEGEDYSTVDFSRGMLTFWEKVCIAQAQICIYKMVSSSDATKHSMLSYLIAATVPLYNDALSCVQDPRLQSEVPKQVEIWGAYCKSNSMMCNAKAEYHTAVVHRLRKEYGYEISRLQECYDKLIACNEFLSSLSSENNTGINTVVLDIKKENHVLIDFVKDRLMRAKKDNYEIFQDEIPSKDKLSTITEKLMAKSNLGLSSTMLNPTVPLFANVS